MTKYLFNEGDLSKKKDIFSNKKLKTKIKENFKNKINGVDLLQTIPSAHIKTIFFDPQYRGILDKMKYGNEKTGKGKERADLPQMTEEIIVDFVQEIDRVLMPSGHLFLWVDKFHLCEGIQGWMKKTNLEIVDLITWDKDKFGLGYRSRRQSEYCLVLQKKPKRAKGVWKINNIPDVWTEKINNKAKTHPHQKPVELQKQLILATTNEGDYVLDPASGSYSVFDVCKKTNRKFIGGDLIYGEDKR